MQSILSVSATKTAALEENNANKKIDSAGSVDEKLDGGKEASSFSDVMDSVIEGEEGSESDLKATEEATSEELASEDLLSEELLSEGDLLDSELFLDEFESDGLDLEGAETTDIEVEGVELEDLELEASTPDELELDPLLDNEALEKVSALGSSTVEGEEAEEGSSPIATLTDTKAVSAIKVESESTKSAVNPILAQIETAQKVDTKVTDVKPENLAEEEVGLKMANKWFDGMNKSTKSGAETVLSSDVSVTEEGSSEALLRSTNKFDSLLSSIKPESAKPIVTNNQVNNEFASVVAQGSADADKVTTKTVNSTPLMQSTALQQPIELQSKQLSAAMGERIMMMVHQGKHEVTIRLDPAELGSMHIKLQVHQEQLQVAIHTQGAQSRDIIEQNLPKLREQLAEQGISLGDANVEQQDQQQQSQSQDDQDDKVSAQHSMSGMDPLLAEQSEWINTQIPIPAQGIDYYA